MPRSPMMMLGLAAAAASLAACSKTNTDEDSPDFRPPTAQTRDDFARGLDTRFGRIDRNSDGAIQADEMQRRRGGGSGNGGGGGGASGDSGTGGAAAAGGRRGARAAMLKALDADGDGEVTRGEFVNGSLARFDQADANHDKTLTSDERKASGLFGGRRGAGAPGN